MPAPKDERLNLRLTTQQDDLIRTAADVEGLNVTDFTVSAALSRARNVLADQRYFALDDAAWTELQTILQRPPTLRPRLAKLFTEPSVLEQ
jgi:uncharacterized protein (DUF1778 family)